MSQVDINSRQTAAVDRSTNWMPIDERTPRGVKIQLICRADGVAHYGQLSGKPTRDTHWFPMPSFAKDDAHGR